MSRLSLLQLFGGNAYDDLSKFFNTLTSATFFAPNNAAIEALLAENRPVADVKAILQYHLIATSKIMAADLKTVNYPESALAAPNFGPTRKNFPLVIVNDANGVTLKYRGSESASVVTPDIVCSNGVIHM
jgi:uncharacterized surface protein with fasciclin (FAS1) repeats